MMHGQKNIKLTLPILMPIRWNASNGIRQFCASVVFFLLFLTVILMNYELLNLRTLQARRPLWCSFLHSCSRKIKICYFLYW